MMTEIFITVLNMSLTASYCIAIVILLRFLLKKQPKILSYLLWSVVLFRMLCPFSFTSSFSLLPMNAEIALQEHLTERQTAKNVLEHDMNAGTVQKPEEQSGVGGRGAKRTGIGIRCTDRSYSLCLDMAGRGRHVCFLRRLFGIPVEKVSA